MQSIAPVEIAPAVTETTAAVRVARVFMLDLLSIVPYYTGHLCEALMQRPDIELEIGAIRYYLDPECFSRMHLQLSPGVDLASRMTGLPRSLRRFLKAVECSLNLLFLTGRFAFRKPDVLHVQFVPMLLLGLPFELWFLRAAKLRGSKIVYTVHNILPHDSAERHRTLYRKLYNFADHLICHDVAARQRLVQEFGCDLRGISVIPHGPLLAPVQRTTQEAARRRLGIPADSTLVLWQGILRPYKGIDFLLRAWSEVSKCVPGAKLAIVGTGDEALLADVRKQVAALGLSSSVQLTLHFVSVAALEDIHTAADILVYPYAEATTSGALLTGLGYDKAIIASRLPAFEQILRHEDNGLLVDYGDTRQFASQLQRLITDPELRLRLAERLRQSRCQEPGWNDIAKQTAACYHALLEVPA